MAGKFDGKRLLMLGSNVGALEMIQYAKANGAYVIAVDYNDVSRSPAKQLADEAVLMSTAETDSLEALIREKHVDGVLSGVSEFHLQQAMELSERCGLRFYCNKQQWEAIEHKECFRRLCEESGVPCPKTYFTGTVLTAEDRSALCYPLVIKPVDASTSAGVYICENEAELDACYEASLAASKKGLIIIEEFVSGNEFTAHFTVCGGKASLSCVDNRYPVAVHEGRVTTIPVARIYPSVFTQAFAEKVSPSMIRLCERLGMDNGVVFIQGIHNAQTGEFWIFEAGLRSAAESPNRFLAAVNGVDYGRVLVDHSLLGVSDFDAAKEDPMLGGKCCGIVSFVAKHGTVGMIDGLEEAVAATPSVVSYESRYPVGSTTPDTDTLRQLMIRFVMVCDSRQAMIDDVTYLNEHISVLNTDGEPMVIKIEPSRILNEF